MLLEESGGNKQSVAELLDSAREGRGDPQFSSAARTRLFGLSGSSVIASPYREREKKGGWSACWCDRADPVELTRRVVPQWWILTAPFAGQLHRLNGTHET